MGLGRIVCLMLAVLALCAAAVLVIPDPAQAQAASTKDTRGIQENSARVIVRPGDSLWSISGRQLGPNATPQQIANGTERLYALNRDRIGADPDLVLAGQELLVPPMLSRQDAGVPPARSDTVEEAKAAPKSTSQERVRGEVSDGISAEGGKAKKTRAALPALSDAAAGSIPPVRTVASNNPPKLGAIVEVGADERRVLGLGILLLTIVVAALVTWKLPMRSTTRRDFERWGIAVAHYGEPPMDRTVPLAHHPGTFGKGETREARRSFPTGRPRKGAQNPIRRIKVREVPVGNTSAVARRIPNAVAATSRVRTPKARSLARSGLALGAHSSEVRDAVRRANATMRDRKHRPRRRTPARRFPVAVERRGR